VLCSNFNIVILQMSIRHKRKKRKMKNEEILQALDQANLDLTFFNTMDKIIREKNAKNFIKTLGRKFNETQTTQLMDMLCKYEEYLDKK